MKHLIFNEEIIIYRNIFVPNLIFFSVIVMVQLGSSLKKKLQVTPRIAVFWFKYKCTNNLILITVQKLPQKFLPMML